MSIATRMLVIGGFVVIGVTEQDARIQASAIAPHIFIFILFLLLLKIGDRKKSLTIFNVDVLQ
ncbi:hypothetical protein [Candidatus Villigracilis affinis]|uniref:hypothetical protein n=1 Tax=Candidatus Villigracilis affinis TaxID=3140682 RepID=UPI001DA464AC|nr:hypothetical protein [Anaerolineales bacterium]